MSQKEIRDISFKLMKQYDWNVIQPLLKQIKEGQPVAEGFLSNSDVQRLIKLYATSHVGRTPETTTKVMTRSLNQKDETASSFTKDLKVSSRPPSTELELEVLEILRKHPESRDNDGVLFSLYLARNGPNFNTISRARRKLQEEAKTGKFDSTILPTTQAEQRREELSQEFKTYAIDSLPREQDGNGGLTHE